MQIRPRDFHRLKKLFLETATLFRVSYIILPGPLNISRLCLAFFRYLRPKALRWDTINLGGLGLVEKAVYFLKQ